MAIATLSDVKTQLLVTGTTDDALLDQLRAAAGTFVEQFCQRSFAGGSFTEDHPGGGRVVFLTNYPLTAVASVNVDPNRQFGPATVLDPSRYLVYADRGLVESLGGPFIPPRPGWVVRANDFPGTVRVAYSTPTAAVPADVTLAFGELVGVWYRQAKTRAALGNQNVIQQTSGSTVTTYPFGLAAGFKVPEAVLQLLRPYRVPNV